MVSFTLHDVVNVDSPFVKETPRSVSRSVIVTFVVNEILNEEADCIHFSYVGDVNEYSDNFLKK